MFPAPIRFKEREGDTIGYKQQVVLPIRLTLTDPTKPALLKLETEFGICRDVCIPVQPALSLELPAGAAGMPAGAPLAHALTLVPRAGASVPEAPSVTRVLVELSTARPRIVIDAVFPGDAAKGDLFLEAPEGIWIPMAQSSGPSATGSRRFEVDLTDGADLADLKGKTIRLTLVGSKGQTETSFKLE
jgi:DsbC/DsbD-like thiol-disulfide interchange protein